MNKLLVLVLILAGCVLTNPVGANEVFTGDQVKKLLSKTCKIDKKYIFLHDSVYEAYPMTRGIIKADCTHHTYKANLFDCDDIAQSIRSIVIRHVADINESGGAVMFGYAGVTCPKDETTQAHAVNVLISNKNKVFIYDYQKSNLEKLLYTPAEYMKEGITFNYIDK